MQEPDDFPGQPGSSYAFGSPGEQRQHGQLRHRHDEHQRDPVQLFHLPGSSWPVTLNLTDVNGNSSTCLSYVLVKETIAPTAICEDVTVQLNASGNAVVYGADLASESVDNCSVWSYSPIAKVYKTFNIGNNNLSITVKDWSGNASTCVSVVTVLPFNGSWTPTPRIFRISLS
jgi:hypothetical protein